MSNLRKLRLAKGVSQKELARLSGIRQATISAIERGASRPRAATRAALAKAMRYGLDEFNWGSPPPRTAEGWGFLEGLDEDLRRGLTEELVARWTHSSTALEGNTITHGDTLFVLREGLTVSGHSLREHQELHGHAQAIAFVVRLLSNPLTVTACHECNRLVQTGIQTDVLAPVGKWKVENNGTQAVTSKGRSKWHNYAAPEHVPALMKQWLQNAALFARTKPKDRKAVLTAYTQLHLGFTAIHPYADGNGRMARLLANLPVLRAGHPPLLIAKESRRRYLQLMGDFSVACGAPKPGGRLVPTHHSVEELKTFFAEEWELSLAIVRQFFDTQRARRRSPR